MISVVIPSFNAEAHLVPTLNALIPAAIEGLVTEAILVDGGSTDGTTDIADAAGMEILRTERGRGIQLKKGAEAAKSDWLLFLHADTVLDADWIDHAAQFIGRIQRGERPPAAATFRFKLDDDGLRPWALERWVALRFMLFRLPYGDQGLLIPRKLYEEIGGFQPMELMEDVDLVRKLKRSQLVMLNTIAVTSAERYRREGYLARGLRNLSCLALYFFRLPSRMLARLYG
ncbi:TIGR04283 family arsenosugar biosynthesis glycosyltransferase [Methyloligella sp. 2.7D]|uniref:TIGR04283 family arsenosugar biosynthesis glycosyltransferase n=1 Tax=unclassified Methyloligella TaxID=2625955 RepID=UPI00157C04D6|nr:TIGR04283 family arsenosugar biosynthesis glycosyltransferase [Methyloligella sp. GL2]QKP78303.1 TIGR04283 family arsenosugar biosynthesis glycosyltransferase [Methyloligella sp. GL2]